MGQMVFVPCTRAQARALRDLGAWEEVAGCAATESLLRAHGYGEATLEDAEFAALGFAGIRAVTEDGDPLRLVLAADVAPSSVRVHRGSDHGSVAVDVLTWAQVRALFSDEGAAAEAVAAARRAASGRSLADALALPEVEVLLEEHDLLWYAPEELDRLPA